MSVIYDYADKVITITGAASGFGKLAAEKFSAAGAKVVISDINGDSVEAVAQQLRDDGYTAIATACDITRATEVESFFALAHGEFGPVDIAVNNAGAVHEMKRLGDCTEDMFDFNIGVNLKGTFLCMKSALEYMSTRGNGVILNIASASGLIGSPFLGLYAAAKHGVIGLTRSAAIEYARKGIRINALCPAFSATAILDQVVAEKGEKLVESIAANIPAQRLAKPEEVVNAILWLCSDHNTYMNGSAISIDGGLVAG